MLLQKGADRSLAIRPGSVGPRLRKKGLDTELEKEGFIDTVAGKGTFVAVQNREFIREKKMKVIEEKLSDAVREARMMGLSRNELAQMLSLLFEEV